MREQMKIKPYLLVLIFGFMFCYACSQNESGEKVGEIGEKLNTDTVNVINDIYFNQTRSLKFELTGGNIDGYWIRLPYNYNKQKLWPIIVYFHGSGLVETDLDSVSNIGPALYAIRDTSQAGNLRN